jgi:hypothetical protein
MIFASGHVTKRCFIYSSWSHKQHLTLPCQLSLIKLSFVRITFLWRNHKKIPIFKGTFIIQIYFLRHIICPFNTSRYIDLTVKRPEVVSLHLKTSYSLSSCTRTNIWRRWIHHSHLFPFKVLWKPIFNGTEPTTCATVTFLWLTIL